MKKEEVSEKIIELRASHLKMKKNKERMKILRQETNVMSAENKTIMSNLINGIKELSGYYSYSEIGNIIMDLPDNRNTKQRIYEIIKYHEKKEIKTNKSKNSK